MMRLREVQETLFDKYDGLYEIKGYPPDHYLHTDLYTAKDKYFVHLVKENGELQDEPVLITETLKEIVEHDFKIL